MVQPGAWRQEPSFDQALERAGHAAATVTLGELDGGRRECFLLVFGGRRGSLLFSDVLAFDLARRQWSVWCEQWPHPQGRSYHSATTVNGEVWLVGGGDANSVVQEVLVFNPASRQWRQPALRGDTGLLRRTAHGACLHPQRPECILLMGGYGGAGEDFNYLSDVVELNTRTGAVRALPTIGPQPEPRAYHAFVAVGGRCYCVAGRTSDSRLIKGKQLLVVFDPEAGKWIVPGVVDGEIAPRSSHRMAAVPGGALLFGGAVDRGVKSGDLHLLVTGQGRLSWRTCWQAGAGGPPVRGAHAAEIAGGRFYVMGGYGERQCYTADCWSIALEAVAGCEATAPAAASPAHKDKAAKQSGEVAGERRQAAPVAEASQWREARRSCPAGAFGAAKRQRVTRAAAAPAAAPAQTPVRAAAVPASPAAADAGSVPCSATLEPPAVAALQQPLLVAAPLACDPRMTAAEVSELQQALQRERVAAAGMQQQLSDLMRQNAEAKADVASWRLKAEEAQLAAQQANASQAQRSGEVADLQRQLRTAQQEAARLDSELLEARVQQRRDKDRAERDSMEKDARLRQMEADLAEQRKANTSVAESLARHTGMLQLAQSQLQEEQQRAGEARLAASSERERLANALRDAQDEAREAAQARTLLQSRFEAEQRAAKEAREELERQQAALRAAQDRTRQLEDDCRKVRAEADEARGKVAAALAARDRAKAAAVRVEQAAELLRRSAEELSGL